MESHESTPSKETLMQKNIEKMIAEADSLITVVARLQGVALVQETLYDPETGNHLQLERIINAIQAPADSMLRDNECPIWLNRALSEKEF
jgi:hypothetical protein